MGKSHAYALGLLGLLLAVAWFVIGRDFDPDRRPAAVETGVLEGAGSDGDAAGTGVVGGPAAPKRIDRTLPPGSIVRGDVVYTREDQQIFRETMAWARSARLDTLELGEMMVRIGRRFVGEPYTPQTLELPGPERVVVNLREFDCVTYVESVLAMARLLRDGETGFDEFVDELRRIRYRGGELDGYVSRLHYFSEWIADNERMGLMRDVTAGLGGERDAEPIDFMSTHAEAYPRLDGQPERIAEIREIERELSRGVRTYIPQAEIAGIVDGIRNGDIIAATSSVRGLDVAHTGFALWQDGRLHLMHAPLVGRSLEISEEPLATRILGIDGQDGIMVARPL